MKAVGTAVSVRANLKKLAFLRGSLGRIALWPIAALVLSLAGWFLLLKQLEQEKRDIENDALAQTAFLSRTYADQLARTIAVIDQIAMHVRYEWELSKGTLHLESIKETGLFMATADFYVAISDSKGALVTSTIPDAKRVHVADKPFFLVQKNTEGDSLFISGPSVGRTAGGNVINFSRKLKSTGDGFSGVVLVSVTADYFTANYDSMLLDEHDFLGIVGEDDVVRVTRVGKMVHFPRSEALTSAPPFPTAAGSMTLSGAEWFSDERSRYVGWSSVPGYPLIALAGFDVHDTLMPYAAYRASSIRQAIWATLALMVFAFIAMGFSARLAWRKHQLELTRAAYRMATEEGDEGFFIVRPIHDGSGATVDFKTVDSNHRAAEFFGQQRKGIIGKNLSQFCGRVAFDHVMGTLRQAADKGVFEGEWEQPAGNAMPSRWIHIKAFRSDGDLAVALRDITESKAHVRELERRGNEDALTGLPNRHWVNGYLPRAVERAAAGNTMLALLFIDLDGFKVINDTMGHEAGDELLRNAGRRLKLAVRPNDKVVRIGGDEFVVIIENIHHTTDAAQVAERILRAFVEGFKLSKGVHNVGTSIGISMFPADGGDADTLLKNADIAMYSVKTSGKRNYRFYDQAFYRALRARHEKEAELRQAIEHDQFVMYYQPRVDISTGTVSSMEALVRWAHPTKGLIEPLDFIYLAEETGLILRLGELVIDKVCSQIAHWAQRGQELVPVSINVSPRQFNETDIAQTLSTALARHRIDPELIEIELTENSMMGEGRNASDAIAAIHRMGVKILVDDFGTGYSSLSQLQRLDFDVLKVDRAFTAQIEKSEQGSILFTAIITMAHALGMRVVAEGVESERQITILKSLKCDEIQGFFISRPLPAAETQPILPKWIFAPTV